MFTFIKDIPCSFIFDVFAWFVYPHKLENVSSSYIFGNF